MHASRRTFLKGSLAAAAATGASLHTTRAAERVTDAELDRVLAEPVLVVSGLPNPVTIASMELLRNRRNFVVRVRTASGDEGLSVPNAMHFVSTYPIFLNRVAPFFVGKDARSLEPMLWDLYRHNDNYKYQGLALWVCVAAAEFAVLDLLGKLSGRSLGEMLGGVRRQEIPVYRASGNRGNTPEQEIAYLKSIVAESGAKALKFRLGGRMRNDNADSLPGRSEALIPLVRETFGPEMTLYADSNSSYDVPTAIAIGRLMETHRYGFFEEPVHFDRLPETKAVADALSIPVAGGEQEFSEARFRWMIANRAVDVVQPDLHYYGGYIRAMRVARIAHAAGLECTPHMSGSGLGYLDVAHFVSCLPNPAAYHEYKGGTDIPVSSRTSSLKVEKGVVRVPSGPGFGIDIDEAFVRESKPVTTF